MRHWAVVLLFLFLARCSTREKVVRLDTGQGEPRIHVLRRDVEPVEVSEEQFKQAIAKHAPLVPAVDHPLKYLLEQARRQDKAANGTPIRWIVAEEKLAGALRKMFTDAELPIEVVHVPPTLTP